jgi:uncharacterized protein YegL
MENFIAIKTMNDLSKNLKNCKGVIEMKEGLSKYLVKKKVFSLIMATSIIFGMLPATVSAVAPGLQIKDNSIDADAVTTIPVSLSDGELWTDKSVVPDAGKPGEFTITLSAAGQDYQIEDPLPQDKLDVVLLLDVSTSMNEKPAGQSKTKLESMKDAARDAVETLLGVSGNRVAIISYSDYATRRTGNNDSNAFLTNENNLKQVINGLSASGYTNIQNAFLRAHQIIDARTNKNNRPVIILMSDGEPTVYHSSLTQHNDSNRTRSTSSGANYVWQTILQAMKAKNEITDVRIFTIGFGVGSSAYAVATLMPTAANTLTYRPNGTNFNHKYWEDGSKITSDGAEDIMEALTGIVNNLVSAKPMSKTGQGSYTDITIEDVLGDGFEVVGTLGTGLSQSGDTITWTIDGDEFDTMASGSTSLDSGKIKTVSFKVKISNSATAIGTYYTNDSAQAVFNVSEDNPFYDGSNKKDQNGDVTETLNNKGWLILENIPDTVVTITITKEVSGPLSENETKTFTFNVYSNPQGGNPLNETPVSITVTGEDSESEDFEISLPWNAFDEAGQVKLYVEEIESAPNGYWTYDNSERKDVTLTKTAPYGSVTFTNIYTPPGNIHVSKVWSIGASNQWPDDVDSIIVQLWEEAPLTESTQDIPPEMFIMSSPEDSDEPDDLDEHNADNNGGNDDEDEPDAVDNNGNSDDEITLISKAKLFFSEPDPTPMRTLIGIVELTSENQADYFEDFIKKEGHRYYLNEVTVNGFSTEMSGDIEDGEVIFDNENRAVVTITNTGNAPGINVTKEVLNSPLTLSGGKATFNFRLVVTNTGNTTLMSVTVDDVMSGPTGANIEYSANTNTDFVIGDMEPGDIRTIEYSVTADKAGTYENVATATGLGYIDEEEYSSEDSATAVANNPTVPPTNPPGGGGSTPRQGTVRVRFVDEDDNVLSAEYQFTGRVGTSYETNARDIEGYTLVEVPDNAEGVFINGTITVVYIYNSDSEEETEIDIEEEEIPEGLPEEPFIDEEIPQAGDILPQTGLPIATVPELLGGTLIALGFYFRRKAKKDEE